jgi:hypothetical protein
LRRAVTHELLIAPTAYIAGTIITSYPLEGFSVVVRTPDEARTQVRNQAACGYDFIKVHNVLKVSFFDVVAEEAKSAGLDLIGHIPHDVTIDQRRAIAPRALLTYSKQLTSGVGVCTTSFPGNKICCLRFWTPTEAVFAARC